MISDATPSPDLDQRLPQRRSLEHQRRRQHDIDCDELDQGRRGRRSWRQQRGDTLVGVDAAPERKIPIAASKE
jgi:hypothetical protein